MSKKRKRLHPIAIFIHSGKRLKKLFIPLIGLLFLGGRGKEYEKVISSLVIGAIAVIFTFFSGLLSWARYTYRIEEGEVRIEYGIFIRKKRYIPLERIQSIDISEGIMQQMFGLAKIEIETAGGHGDAEVVLSAVSKNEARLLQESVAAVRNRDQNEAGTLQNGTLVYQISTSQLLTLSLTTGGAGVVISAVFAFMSQLEDFISFKKWLGGMEHNITLSAILIFLGFLIAWVIALVGTMVKYANFTVVKTERDLVISQGFLERRQFTIPLNRIQAIRIRENFIRQFLGYAAVYLESAGGSALHKESANILLLPIIKLNQMPAALEPFLSEYQLNVAFTGAPKRAMRRYILRSWYITLPIVITSLIFLKVWGLLSLVLLFVVTVWSVLKYRDAGWSLENHQLSLRFRFIVRTSVFMKKNKIQCLKIRESYFQRKKGLGSVEAFVKSGFGSGGGEVIDLEQKDLQKIYTWYSK